MASRTSSNTLLIDSTNSMSLYIRKVSETAEQFNLFCKPNEI